MKRHDSKPPEEVNAAKRWVVVTFILLGFLLIAVSLLITSTDKPWPYVHELLKELGIVVLAVFSVSLIYELLIARKYLQHFLSLLQTQIQQGESNSAICTRLGILRIFPSRDLFEKDYPITAITSGMARGSKWRVIARSLFLMMSKPNAMKNAIEQGAIVELCLFDPSGPADDNVALTDLEVTDIQSAISVFKKEIETWITTSKPSGSVEVRYHRLLLFDSFTTFSYDTEELCIWDLSFGRDVTAKRIVVVDATKPFGVNLTTRYDRIWSRSNKVFYYDGVKKVIEVNQL